MLSCWHNGLLQLSRSTHLTSHYKSSNVIFPSSWSAILISIKIAKELLDEDSSPQVTSLRHQLARSHVTSTKKAYRSHHLRWRSGLPLRQRSLHKNLRQTTLYSLNDPLVPSSLSLSVSLVASRPHGSALASAHGTCSALIGWAAAVFFSHWWRSPRPRPWRWWGLARLGLLNMQDNSEQVFPDTDNTKTGTQSTNIHNTTTYGHG